MTTRPFFSAAAVVAGLAWTPPLAFAQMGDSKAVKDARLKAFQASLMAIDDVAVDYDAAPAARATRAALAPPLGKMYAALKATLAGYKGQPLAAFDGDVGALEAAIVGAKPTPTVRAAARSLERRLLKDFAIEARPTQTPDPALGAKLYKDQCTSCHGDKGAGDGPLAAKIGRPIARFSDTPRMARTAPLRVFLKTRNGVSDSAMPAYAEKFEEDELWSLSFYVASLAHRAETAPPAAAFPEATRAVLLKAGLSQARLALETEDELTVWLASLLPASAAATLPATAAALRTIAPFLPAVPRS